ncbi:hypothetical protein TNCV_4433451 [Trichonephila clavipes]|nr:hypothetical protein TNCV_4433451 [Trichonephila clavipes]
MEDCSEFLKREQSRREAENGLCKQPVIRYGPTELRASAAMGVSSHSRLSIEKILIRIISKVKCYFRLYYLKNLEFRTIYQLATCDDHRPCTVLGVPPYTIIATGVASPKWALYQNFYLGALFWTPLKFHDVLSTYVGNPVTWRPGMIDTVDTAVVTPLIITHSVKRRQSIELSVEDLVCIRHPIFNIFPSIITNHLNLQAVTPKCFGGPSVDSD